jgi:hypothetical protein
MDYDKLEAECKVDTYRQAALVNQPDTGVRVTHLVTGLRGFCSEHKSIYKKEIVMKNEDVEIVARAVLNSWARPIRGRGVDHSSCRWCDSEYRQIPRDDGCSDCVVIHGYDCPTESARRLLEKK